MAFFFGGLGKDSTGIQYDSEQRHTCFHSLSCKLPRLSCRLFSFWLLKILQLRRSRPWAIAVSVIMAVSYSCEPAFLASTPTSIYILLTLPNAVLSGASKNHCSSSSINRRGLLLWGEILVGSIRTTSWKPWLDGTVHRYDFRSNYRKRCGTRLAIQSLLRNRTGSVAPDRNRLRQLK